MRERLARLLISLLLPWLAATNSSHAEPPALLDGNFISNPSFELDRHHNNAEGHVLAFMGDWAFNVSDLKPDYCNPAGSWVYADGVAHSGRRSLLFKGNGSLARGAVKVAAKGKHAGDDSRWGTPAAGAAKFEPAVRLATTVRGSVWYRSNSLGGEKRVVLAVRSCNVSKSASADKSTGDGWARLDVVLTKKEIEVAFAAGQAKGVQMGQVVSVKVEGGAEVYVDDLSMSEELLNPSLAANAGFEDAEKDGYPEDWGQPRKYRFYTQQYYKWTSWNHFFGAIRGKVSTTDLVARSGRRSLLMQVYPGDEMLVEGGQVTLNQTKPGIVEVGAFVRIDRIKWIDIRAVDQDGNEIPCVDAFNGGWPIPKDDGQIYPSNSPDWLYVRKPFLTEKPLKGIRPRLCARGFNGDTRDDGGTRPNVNQVGLVWWDDVQVNEITATVDELKKRRVKTPRRKNPSATAVMVKSLDLGDRMFGENTATLVLHNPTRKSAAAKVKLTIEGSEAAPSRASVTVPANGEQVVRLPYVFGRTELKGSWREQGGLKLEIAVGNKTRTESFAYNTWPVIVDVDMTRHYATANENPQQVTMNFGVAAATMRKAKSLRIEIRRKKDDKKVDTIGIRDFAKAMGDTRAQLAQLSKPQFVTPNPAVNADRANLLAINLDLRKVKLRPFDQPVRDHYLSIAGLDAKGKELFTDKSQPFGRVHPNTEVLPKITSTKVRKDGAVLINGKPVFLVAGNGYITGRFTPPYTPGKGGISVEMNKTMGVNCIRWVEKVDQAAENWKANLYSLETMVNKGHVTDQSLAAMKAQLPQWKKEGKLDGVITLSPFYEHSIRFNGKPIDAAEQARHAQFTKLANNLANRISNFGAGGAHNIYTIDLAFDAWDTFGLEIEPMGPPRGGYELAPILRKGGVAWFHLPQTYNNTPFEFFRFDQYVTILQGGRGISTIHGLGDPSFMRGITGEIRHLSPAIFSDDHGDTRTSVTEGIWWMQRKVGKTTTVIALNKPAVEMGRWTWKDDPEAPGGRSHTGISEFTPRPTPDGMRLHGFRETKPVIIQAGDKLVQHVRIDPKAKPTAITWGVRGDAKWDFNAHHGKAIDFNKWRNQSVNHWLAGELLPGTWQVAWAYNDATRNIFADLVLHPGTFKVNAALPAAGKWTRLEMEADKIGLVGKQIDGFFFIAKDGEAQWAHSAVARGDQEIVLCGGTLGPGPEQLAAVRFEVPWAKNGRKVKVLFEEREVKVKDGAFVDDFSGEDYWQTVRGGATGDAVGWHAPGTDLKAQTLGYVTPSGPAAVHVYEIEQ